MKNKLLLLLLLGIAPGLKAQELDQFIRFALENSLQIQAETSRYQASAAAAEKVSIWQDPVLSAGYNVLNDGMTKASVSLMQNFAWFGTTGHQKEAAKAREQSAAQRLEALKKQVSAKISLAYFNLQENLELQQLQTEMMAGFDELEEFAQNRTAAGRATTADVMRAQMEKDKLAVQIRILQQEQKNLEHELNILAGRTGDEPVHIVPVAYASNVQEKDAENHPQIEAVNLKIREMDAEALAVGKESLPNFGIGVEYMWMRPAGGELMPMLSISLPVFRRKYNARIQEAKLLSKAYEHEKNWLLNEMNREKNTLKTGQLNAEKEMELYSELLEKAGRTRELLLAQYSASSAGFGEIIRLQQEIVSYKIKRIEIYTEALKLQARWYYLNNGF